MIKTLSDIKKLAESLPQSPQFDNNDPLHPDFTSFYNQYAPSKITRLLVKTLHKFNIPFHSHYGIIEEFRTTITNLIQQNARNEKKGNYIEKLTVPEAMNTFIWSNLYGAIHSLVRDLAYLNTQQILQEDLKLKDTQQILIFNGNVTGPSPYNLQTLLIIMKLMEQNPEQVIFIRGDYEEPTHWQEYNLKYQLIFEVGQMVDDEIPMESLVTNFFQMLPQAVYLVSQQNNTKSFFRISSYSLYEQEMCETISADFLLSSLKERDFYILNPLHQSTSVINLEGAVIGLSNDKISHGGNGLMQLIPQFGATIWGQLSGCSPIYAKTFDFFYDSFVAINTKPAMNDWTITEYFRDTRNPQSIFSTQLYNALSGKKLTTYEPSNTTELIFGNVSDFTKATSAPAQRVREGMCLRIMKANAESEVPGKRIRIFMLDDEYTPYLTLRGVNKIMHDYHTDMFLETVGTPTHEALLPLIREKKILVMFNFGGASLFRKPDLPYNIFYRTSYEQEAESLVDYAISELHTTKFGIIYQDDAFGFALREGALRSFKKHGITEWMDASYARNTLNIDEAIQKTREHNPEVILCFGTRSVFINFIERLGIPFFANKFFMASTFTTDIFRDYLREKGFELIIARVVPDPHGDTEIAQEFRRAHEQYMPQYPITVDAFEAYINTSLFIEALKHIQGDVTKEKLVAYFESIKDMPYKGLHLSYDPQTQELSQYKDIWIDDGKKWTYLPGKKESTNK